MFGEHCFFFIEQKFHFLQITQKLNGWILHTEYISSLLLSFRCEDVIQANTYIKYWNSFHNCFVSHIVNFHNASSIKVISRFNQPTFVTYICVISATCYLILNLHRKTNKQTNKQTNIRTWILVRTDFLLFRMPLGERKTLQSVEKINVFFHLR